ncbi:hypothetical protein [Halomarina pelagica]|uniref:hypothetical protein n=1 Tax=Halomarina pelagica TaxID=2961599 RepID=UPI0020C34E61|nr:hypothetical protein [Halomarina sp. BND7]
MVGADVYFGVALTVLAWLGLAIAVAAGRANVRRRARRHVRTHAEARRERDER